LLEAFEVGERLAVFVAEPGEFAIQLDDLGFDGIWVVL
jgi:hypothetical protein